MTTTGVQHSYIGDGIPDHRGDDRCVTCQRPRRHPDHDLPPASEAQAAHRERIGDR
jgi:hypothetical protein